MADTDLPRFTAPWPPAPATPFALQATAAAPSDEDPACVALANTHPFKARDTRRYREVRSRMLLWCRDGFGEVTVNGVRYRMEPGTLLILPWRHAINYRAAERNPMRATGVHLIPGLSPGHPLPYGAVHHQPLPAGQAAPWWQHDRPLPELADTRHDHMLHHPSLEHLVEYTLHACRQAPDDLAMRLHLGALLLAEFRRVAASAGTAAGRDAMPAALHRAQRYALEDLAAALTVDLLARHAGVSASTLLRVFRRHLDTTPMAWLTARRLEAAADRLLNTTDRIAEVAAAVGIADARYFARQFGQHYGATPSAYRQRHALLAEDGEAGSL